jgi:hypothetical protein
MAKPIRRGCRCEGCKAWISALYFCCHSCREIMGPDLYVEATRAWYCRPFDGAKFAEVLNRVNIQIKQAVEAARERCQKA